jgi:hypothetical protein
MTRPGRKIKTQTLLDFLISGVIIMSEAVVCINYGP